MTGLGALRCEPAAMLFLEDEKRQGAGDCDADRAELQSPQVGRGVAPVRSVRPGVAQRLLEECAIAEKHLVRAFAGQNDRYDFSGFLREQELADRRQGDERQFREPQALLEMLPEHVLRHAQLMMLRSQELRGAARPLTFIAVAPGERDGKG